jgi:lipooligosaccharide transport system permease protein
VESTKTSVNFSRVQSRGALYVAEYRLRNMAKWWLSVLIYGIGNPVLFLTSIGVGVGALVDANSGGEGIGGVPYLTFLAPALLASAAIQATMDETMFPTLEGFIWRKMFYGMHATSLTAKQIVDGVMIAAMVRNVITAGIYGIVMWLFGAASDPRAWLAIFSAVFAGWAMGAAMQATASFVEHDDGFFAIVGRFIIAPMFLFSGTFYPLESMPLAAQMLGWISPLWHATELGRWLSYGYPQSIEQLFTHVVYLLVVGLIGTKIAHYQYSRRLTK